MRICRGVSVAVLAVLAISTALAQARAVHRFDVESQPLGKALNVFAAQAGMNVYFNPAEVEGMSVSALKTEATVEEALKSLLLGTELEAICVDEKTVRVGKRKIARNEIRLAQADRDRSNEVASAEEGAQLFEIVVTAQRRKSA